MVTPPGWGAAADGGRRPVAGGADAAPQSPAMKMVIRQRPSRRSKNAR